MEKAAKNANDKLNKLKKLNAYEGFWVEFNNIIHQIMNENLNVLSFRNNLKNLINKIITEVSNYEYYFMKMISSLETPHKYLSHSLNTAIITYILSLNLGVDSQMILKLIQAALFHDVGKLDFNDKIKLLYLFKGEDPAQITQNHPVWGERVLLYHLKADPEIARIVLNHHEQNDGSGYPRGLNGRDLTIYDHILITANLLDNISQKMNYPGIESLAKNIEVIFANYSQKFIVPIRDVLNGLLSLGKEGRKHRRFKVIAKCRVENEILNINTLCDVINISSGGIGLATPIILNPGMEYMVNTKITPDFYLKDEKCKVIWDGLAEGKFVYGMKFGKHNEDIITKIMNVS